MRGGIVQSMIVGVSRTAQGHIDPRPAFEGPTFYLNQTSGLAQAALRTEHQMHPSLPSSPRRRYSPARHNSEGHTSRVQGLDVRVDAERKRSEEGDEGENEAVE